MYGNKGCLNEVDGQKIQSKLLDHVDWGNLKTCRASSKGSDWIRLVFAHPFPLYSGAPIASAIFIAQIMGAPLFKSNGWAKSSPYPVSPFSPQHHIKHMDETLIKFSTMVLHHDQHKL